MEHKQPVAGRCYSMQRHSGLERATYYRMDAMKPTRISSIKYRSEIDGLRAVAVLPVILFHAGFKLFAGGFVGVDVFFVISGYLITSILLKDLSRDRYSVVKFYERRARRILPALFTVAFFCIPFAWLWMTPGSFDRFGQSLISVATFSSNIFFWKNTGYFAGAAGENPLLHTWSLAVEEQFYLFFPLLLFALWKAGKRALIVAICTILFSSLALSEWGRRFHPAANFFLLPPRAWELMLGSLVALAHSGRNSTYIKNGAARDLMSLVGLALILYSVFFFDEKIPFPSLYTLIPAIGTALILNYGSSFGLSGRILSSRLLVFVGLISYSAYLWHQPLFAFSKILYTTSPPAWLFLVLSALSMLLAWLSWRFIERPFRAKNYLSQRTIWIAASAFISATIAIGVSLHLTNGLPSRMPSSYVRNHWGKRLSPNYGLNQACDFKGKFKPVSECIHGLHPKVLLWGDSYAMSLADGLAASHVQFIQATRSDCGPNFIDAPFLDRGAYNKNWTRRCFSFEQQILGYLANHDAITTVVMSSPFSQYLNNDLYDGKRFFAPSDARRLRGFIRTVELIRALGKYPVVVAPPPQDGEEIAKCLKRHAAGLPVFTAAGTGLDCSFRKVKYKHYEAEVIAFLRTLERRANLPVIWIGKFTCNKGRCATSQDGVPLYRGGGHLSREGSALLFRRYDILSNIAAKQGQGPWNCGYLGIVCGYPRSMVKLWFRLHVPFGPNS